ncbi:hypothetical protein Tco_0460836 [Tanacetum coccineum]
MSTPAHVDSDTITQADGVQVVDTYTESDPEEAPSEAEELQSLGSRVPLMGEEFEAVEPSGTRTDSSHLSTLLDSTIPFSPDHKLTHVSPTPTPTRVLFPHRTARMAVRTQPTLSSGMSARITEAIALSLSSFHKRYRSSYETSSSLTLPVRKRYRGTSKLILDTNSERDEKDTKRDEEDTKRDKEDESLDANEKRLRLDNEGHGLDDEDYGLGGEGLGLQEEVVTDGQQQAVSIIETTVSEPLGLGYGALRRRELAGAKRVSAFRQPTLVTWVDPEDDRVYTDILAYAPRVAPVQTPPSPEWSFGSLPISQSSSLVPSPIALRVATSTATRLDALPPTLFVDMDRDVRELYTRSGVVKYEIFSQRPVLALDAWAGRVDTRLADMSRDRYDDHRLIHDMLMQQAAMQRELQEMRGHVTALEQERDHRE